jgi:hypothetical protein
MSFKEDIYEPQVIVLAVFGQNNQLSETDLHQHILYPLLEEWGRTPDTILLPNDGKVAFDIQEWAESIYIKTKVFHSDWAQHGKVAQILRNDRMMKECTHSLFFLSSRAKRLEQFAEKWVCKKKEVFTFMEGQLTHLVPPDIPPEVPPENPRKSHKKASARDHKSNTGTMLKWLKYQTKE